MTTHPLSSVTLHFGQTLEKSLSDLLLTELPFSRIQTYFRRLLLGLNDEEEKRQTESSILWQQRGPEDSEGPEDGGGDTVSCSS